MRQIDGLTDLKQQSPARLNAEKLAMMLIDDLQACYCSIYGISNDDNVLLARLDLVADTLNYDAFDQRLDWVVAGPIVRNDCVPLTYRMQGRTLALSGRCSMIARVCGVDLYLQRSYTGVLGDVARQRFSLSVNGLLKL
jgi:hypothetical protein